MRGEALGNVFDNDSLRNLFPGDLVHTAQPSRCSEASGAIDREGLATA